MIPLLIVIVFASVCFLIAGRGWSIYEEWVKKASFRRPSEGSMRFRRIMFIVAGVVLLSMGVVVVVHSAGKGSFW